MFSTVPPEEVVIAPVRRVPARVLGKGIVTAQIHAHGLAAFRAVWNELRRNLYLRRHALREKRRAILTDNIALRLPARACGH